MGDDGGVRITTLGPLAVDGRPVRGDRLATVLRELIGARGRTVSTGMLIDAVWQGAAPDDAAGAVQALISRVRRLGLPVLAGPGGYRVPADEVQVDAVLVRELVERGRKALRNGDAIAARQDADEARALFPEIPELADADADGVRLFGDVAALRAEAALAGRGPFDEADLRRLVARTPPDEPAAALLVRVLAAQGRDAEALAVVEQLRAELADRYGTDPSPLIGEVHLALLRGELAVAPPRRGTMAHLPAAWRRATTALVGRERDLAAVTAALADVPLVTVVATGGAGKTRLAAEVARRATRPVRVIELAGLRSPAEVLPAVLAALGGVEVAPAGSGPGHERRVLSPEERLRSVAPELDGLLVLDNCEHVLEAAAGVVADLLAAAPPEVTVLATSRAPLGLVGEVVHRLAALPDAEALALLESRARAGGAAPTWGTERALALCNRLDNLPLALELAAARLRHMPIDDVLAGLSDRFALLDDALRGLPERHASLWAMVDWSRELLAPAERGLLQRLAVIPAPFTADLAAAVAAVGGAEIGRGPAEGVAEAGPGSATGGVESARGPAGGLAEDRHGSVAGGVEAGRAEARPRSAAGAAEARRGPAGGLAEDRHGSVTGGAEVRRGLAALVEHSLLRLEEDDGGAARYRMLETVREYGEARLDAAAGRGSAMAGLVDWARRRSVTLAADFIGPGQIAALDGCAAEQDNFLAALRWSVAYGDEPATVDVAVALFQLWTVRGLHVEVSTWARGLLHVDDPAARSQSAIMHGRGTGRPLPHADRLAWMCVLVGINAGITGPVRLNVLARRALRTLFADRPGEVSPRQTALGAALPGLEAADPAEGLRNAEMMIAHPDPYVQGLGFFVRAALNENAGTPELSVGDAESAYRRFESVGDHWGMGMAAQAAGYSHHPGPDAQAGEWLRRGERHLELVGAAQDARSIRVRLDVRLALAGDPAAERRLRELTGSDEVDEMDLAQAGLGLAQLAWQRGQYDEASEHADAVLRTLAGVSPLGPQPWIMFRIAAEVIHLRIAEVRQSPAVADARAAEVLALARDEVLAAHDGPLLGAWALGGAEIAAFRGDVSVTRELWALGTRIGANAGRLFPSGDGERLAAALGGEQDREPLLAGIRELRPSAVNARIRALMDQLLR